MVTVYLFKLLLLSDAERTHLAFAQAQSEAQVFGGMYLMPLGAALNYWGWELKTENYGTFCVRLRSRMNPPEQRPLKFSLPSVLPPSCFTCPSLLSGTLPRTKASSPALLPGGKEGGEVGWMPLCKGSDSPQRKKINVKR